MIRSLLTVMSPCTDKTHLLRFINRDAFLLLHRYRSLHGVCAPRQDARVDSAHMTRARVASTIALTFTIGVAGASWVVAIERMNGMNMGLATRLGSFSFFFVL